MTQHMPPQAMTLFDLIARSWKLDGDVRQLCFNAAGSSLVAMSSDGRLAFIALKDVEHPDARVRIEADTGRMSIRPRGKPLPAPVTTDALVARPEVPLCRNGNQGFCFAHRDTGALWRATARGQTLPVKGVPDEVVTAVAALPGSGSIAVAFENRLVLIGENGGTSIASTELPHPVDRIEASADGNLLGCFGPDSVSVVGGEGMGIKLTLGIAAEVVDAVWSPCKRWLVAGCRGNEVLLIDVPAGTIDRIVDFPQAVQAVGFNAAAGALVAAGAFRVVGWKLPDLPFGDHGGTPIETGKPGLTIVDRVAVHPSRDLCAVSYANGLVVICRVGQPDEMLLREGSNVPVTALVWSDDGAHLAIGAADGNVSIATFPKNMFK